MIDINKKIAVNFNYSVAAWKEPIYWFEDGKIKSDTGASIGWDNQAMTRKEAEEMANLCGFTLQPKGVDK